MKSFTEYTDDDWGWLGRMSVFHNTHKPHLQITDGPHGKICYCPRCDGNEEQIAAETCDERVLRRCLLESLKVIRLSLRCVDDTDSARRYVDGALDFLETIPEQLMVDDVGRK